MDIKNNMNSSSSINCNVTNCSHNDAAHSKCTLDCINVSCSNPDASANTVSQADTICSSFASKGLS